jgi:hypothetical protein
MTLRLVAPAPIDQPVIRPSARIARVAQLLDEDPRQVRRMLERGDLEGHKSGKRGIRVFLDSVEAWQKKTALGALAPAQPPRPVAARQMTGATQAAHRQAKGYLQTLGLVPASRR